MHTACDEYVPSETRVLMAIELFAWGNLSDYALDRMPRATLEGLGTGPDDPTKARPMTQKRLGELIGMKKSTVNDAVKTLKNSGYLKEHVYLFPNDSVKPLGSEKDPGNDPVHPDSTSPLFLRLKELVIERDKDAKIIPQLELECKRYDELKAEVLNQLAPHRRRLWQIWRDVQRGKSPLGITKTLLESAEDDNAA